MALTSKFIADFTSFYDAVQKASVMVKDLSKDADKAGNDFNKMVTSLSGEKVRQQATVMARAVEEVGGASKLTDAELKRVNATVTEAADKMRKLGIAVPQSFKDIQQAAEGINKPTEGWGSTLTSLTSIVRGFMALQIVGWFKDAAAAGFEWASSMAKMKAQTDLTYRDLQILEDVATNTGTSIETLAKGVQIMQKSIGDRTARAGIEALGLSFDAILKMKPADQFAAIATAIAKIEDPNQRATAAAKIFGNTYREMMPALRGNIADIAKNTKLVADTQIDAADRASARWEKFWKDQKKGWAAWAGGLVEGVEQGMSAWDKAQQRAEALRRGGTKALIEMDAAAAAATPKPLPILGGSQYPNQLGWLPSVKEGTGAVAALNKQIAEHAAELKKAAAEQERFGAAVDKSLERVRYQHFQLGQSAVAASQNVAGFGIRMSETVAINNDYSRTLMDAQIKTDAFGHTLTSNVMPSLQGIGTATYQAGLIAKESASKQEILNSRMNDITGILAGVQTGWAQMAVTGARAIQGITNDLIAGNWIGAITKATAALGGFIAKLFSGSEESKKVSPLREEFFKLQGGLETLNPRVQALTGNVQAVQAVFDAKTLQQYQAAVANLERILAQEQKTLDDLSDSADDYAASLKKIPSKVPIEFRYSESGSKPQAAGDVPGFATGTDGKFVNFGSGTLAMLHGKEAIVPESAVRGGGGASVAGSVTINVNAQGAFFDTPGDLQRLADKVNDALTAKYGLTNRTRAA